MAIEALNNPAQALAGYKAPEERIQQKTLGQDDFFKLLTTQLASQDPMAPMEDTAFIAQMASFSELEMTSNLTKSFGKFTSSQQFAAAHGYIGKTVSLASGEIGEVTSVERQDDQTLVFLNGKNTDGRDINSIYKVEVTPKPANGSGSATQRTPASDSSVERLARTAANFIGPQPSTGATPSNTRSVPSK